MDSISPQARWRNQLVTRTCIECGLDFTGRRAQNLCEPCKVIRRRRFRPQTFRVCAHCGQTFGPVEHLRADKKYCSLACKGAAERGKPSKKRGMRYPHLQRARVATCLTCGKEFRAVKDTAREQQKYCSHSCYLKNRRVSHFEQAVFAWLRDHVVAAEEQVRRGPWTFDGAVIGTNVLIEADGTYWHSLPHARERDKRKDAWCAQEGYVLLRVPEAEFRANADAAMRPVMRALARPAQPDD